MRANQVSYLDLMREYGAQRGLKRLMIPVPILSPRLSSLWLGLVTPVYARVGRQLVDSLRNETVVHDKSAEDIFSVHPLGFREALRRASVNEDKEFAATHWSDAFCSVDVRQEWGGSKFGRRIVDSRSIVVPFSPAKAFRPIERLGGQTGWYYANWLWRTRGFLDLLFNGAGMRRGRRNPDRLMVGNTVDFWRVEEIQPEHLLRLRAEMRLPGARLAAIRSRLPGLRVRRSTDSDFRSRRNNGPAVLVCALSAAPIRISRDAEGPRPRDELTPAHFLGTEPRIKP